MELIRLPRDPQVLESIARLAELPHWQRLKDEARKKLESNESSISRLLFKTRSPVDPVEIEYFRGFRQGVTYVLEALPYEALQELKKLNEDTNKQVD